jgi:hypothetical protein
MCYYPSMAAEHGSFGKKQTPPALFDAAFLKLIYFLSISMEAGIWVQLRKALWESRGVRSFFS